MRRAIEHARHFLPTQGPIAVFIHHNTLHALESLPFEQAVLEGLKLYGAQPYWPEARYREEMERGRIVDGDLQTVLRRDLREKAATEVVRGTTRYDLRYRMLCHPVLSGSDAELQWLFAQSDALDRFREGVSPTTRATMLEGTRQWVMRDLRVHLEPSAIPSIIQGVLQRFPLRNIEAWEENRWQQLTLQLLWRICQNGVHATRPPNHRSHLPNRHRDILLKQTHFDCDRPVHDLLIRFTSAFLDQGFAAWTLPNRDQGFYRCFLSLFAGKSPWTEKWLQPLQQLIEFERLTELPPLESIAESLRALGVAPADYENYIIKTLLALPGWTGMVEQMATNASWTLHPAPPASLEEFLAIRLILDRLSALRCLEEYHSRHSGRLAEVLSSGQTSDRYDPHRQTVQQRAFDLFQLAQRLGWSPRMLHGLTTSQWQTIVDEVGQFDDLERRRMFHLAYEHRYRSQLLDAISEHSTLPLKVPETVLFQVVTCIDDREESFRRHLEELEPSVETFGAAGFFSVPMYFRGAADAHFIPLCPVIMTPKHYVEEVGPLSAKQAEARRTQTRMLLGKASQTFHLSSRTLVSGFLTSLLGSLNAFPLVARVLFPRLTSQIRGHFGRLVRPTVATQLSLERGENSEVTDKGAEGFTLVEMANMLERLITDLGIQGRFAPLVVIMGHGSSSLNNPHESAYNCGACGGGKGGPNARAVALIGNDPRVRALLRERGLVIPDTTLFVGGFHNTCDDSIEYFDIDRIPPNHSTKFLAARDTIDRARRRNAHERARRFYSLELSCGDDVALRHVERRAEDLAQVRPEYNHATNAACFVGRRGRTRGLFMDRRCFLTSYDPTTDDAETSILLRIMQAVIPVCGGISLEYYFSTVDNVGYGCGTKLPHNITSLLGVMEGATSDLRTGLSQQMVEIHEPIRILFVAEAKPEAILSIMERNALINTYIRNHWVQMATLDPYSNEIHLFQGDAFEKYEPSSNRLPVVAYSIDWYRGWREALCFARVDATAVGSQPQFNGGGR